MKETVPAMPNLRARKLISSYIKNQEFEVRKQMPVALNKLLNDVPSTVPDTTALKKF